MRVPDGQTGRWQPPRSFAGRLVRLDAAGPRHRGLPEAIERATGERPPERAWLLVDGEEPAQSRWVLVLAATFLGFALWHGATVARLLRRAH
ncbi:MAG: hypothetical protein JOZ69_00210 [Myxococcales bacterium]|nr:hypothetical protein [Myxococcales bacterium]